MPGYWNAHSDRDYEDPFGLSDPRDEIEDDEYDESEECGRWYDGKLNTQCMQAGTEWCDWICPIGLPHRAKRQG